MEQGDDAAAPVVDSKVTVVMIGKVGTGKSATGNMLLGFEGFKSMSSATGVTKTCTNCQTEDGKLCVIDTPGLGDETQHPESLLREIGKSIRIAGPGGVTAMLLVLSLSTRITDEGAPMPADHLPRPVHHPRRCLHHGRGSGCSERERERCIVSTPTKPV
jgi:hypothetical protein